MWVDLAIIAFLVLYAISGIERGFFALVADMGSFILAFLIALRFYAPLGQLFTGIFPLPVGWANALGFILVAVIAESLLAQIFYSLIRRLPPKVLNSQSNRLLGLFPALIDGLIILAFVLTVLVSLPTSPVLKSNITGSQFGGIIYHQTISTEKTLAGIFGSAVSDTLNFLTVRPTGSETVNLHFNTASTNIDPAGEQEMLAFVNAQRQQTGLPLLVLDEKLTEVARAHSRDMFARGYFSHINPDGQNPFDRIRAAGINFVAAGENIAYAPTANLADTGLINSPEHRANILSPDYSKVGIGVIDGGIYGKMFTQDFTN